LAQVGTQLMAALASANDRTTPAHPWIARDPTRGTQSLKVPLPDVTRQLVNALSVLAESLRGGHQ